MLITPELLHTKKKELRAANPTLSNKDLVLKLSDELTGLRGLSVIKPEDVQIDEEAFVEAAKENPFNISEWTLLKIPALINVFFTIPELQRSTWLPLKEVWELIKQGSTIFKKYLTPQYVGGRALAYIPFDELAHYGIDPWALVPESKTIVCTRSKTVGRTYANLELLKSWDDQDRINDLLRAHIKEQECDKEACLYPTLLEQKKEVV